MSKAHKLKQMKGLVKKRRKLSLNREALQEAEDMVNYKIDEMHEIPPKENAIQHNEINGRLGFDTDNYHCQEYNNLLKSIIPIRSQFAATSDLAQRKSLATEEISHWHNYMTEREKALPSSYHINEVTLSLLEEVFHRESERRNNTLSSERIVDFHYTFAKYKKFDIEIHRRNLVQILHPYQGYMCGVADKFFKFDEMIKMYRQQLVSSYERSIGQTFLAGKPLFINLHR
jgi:hypothetical protein